MISYADVQSVYRSEKAGTELQKIDDCFYPDSFNLLEKIAEEHREYIKKLVEEIFERRRNKIVLAALRSGQKEPANMVPAEKTFYARIIKDINEYRSILSGPDKTNGENASAANTAIKKTKVRFLTQFPSIIGPDMVHYGPFKEGDTADIPADNAIVLIEHDAAEEA
jgi:DNA replication initiation complex subunit (GINS family)